MKPEIRYLLHLQKNDFRSHFGRNCLYLCQELNTQYMEEINTRDISMPITTPNAENWRVPFIKDLISLRDSHQDEISRPEINDFLDHVCCS